MDQDQVSYLFGGQIKSGGKCTVEIGDLGNFVDGGEMGREALEEYRAIFIGNDDGQ